MARMLAQTAVALAFLFAADGAQARKLADVAMDDTMDVGGTTLKLNGIALRTKAIFKVYVGGLYLQKPMNDENAIVAEDSPRALVMQFVRDVDRDNLVDAYREGFNNNSPKYAKEHKADVERFLKIVKDIKEGQRVVFTYVPGKGSTVTWPGGKTELFEGKAFADAYLLMYVGKEPPTSSLKRGLLGK